MNRKIAIVFLLVFTMILSSCSLGGGRMFFDNDDKIANKRLEQVIEAIKNQDRDALKAMFSKNALAEADDFDEHIDYLFEFFQGEVESCDDGGGPIVDEDTEYGKKTKEVKSFFDVITDKQKYVFFLLDYPVDTINPDNVGLYTLRVIKAEDEKAQLTYWQDMKIPGIYKPGES